MAIIKRIKHIIDRWGKPVETAQLTDPQTARIQTLHWEVAGHPSRGLTPARLARVLSDAEQGDMIAQNDLFEDMEEKDGHLFAELSKRRRSIMGLDWTVAPPRGATSAEKKHAALIEEMLRDLENLEDIVFECTDAIGKGYACQEIKWDHSEGQWMPVDIDARPQRWFTVLPWDRNELRLRDPAEPYGAELWPFGWIVHKHRAKSGYITRAALFRVLAWPYLFKQYSVRDLAEFLEIYGLPLRLGKYPSGSSDSEKATLMRAVMAVGHSAAGIIPEGMAIDFQQAAEGSADPFKAMLEWCEATESKAIVGQTLTAQPGSRGGGSHALGKVHDEVRWDITVSDARQIAPTLTRQLVYALGILNGLITDPTRCPRFKFDVAEVEDMAAYSDALPKLTGIGMRIPTKWAHERLGIPQPEDDEAVLRSPVAPPPGAGANADAGTAAPDGQAALKAKATPGTGDTLDTIDRQTARLGSEAHGPVSDMLDTLRHLVDQADSLEQLAGQLEHAFAGHTPDQLAELMAKAMTAAELAGRYDIVEQALGS